MVDQAKRKDSQAYLGKPSLKKNIFLLTFVNKQGGGLERASSIKKTIAKLP